MLTRSILAVFIGLTLAGGVSAQTSQVSLRDNFPVGSNQLCSAQLGPADAEDGMFDRRYLLTCRDAAASVGRFSVLRGEQAAAAEGECSAIETVSLEGIGSTQVRRCQDAARGIEELRYSYRSGNRTYVASGLAGYASALEIGLRTLVGDEPIVEEVEIAITDASDAAAFARLQAQNLSTEAALGEAYRRNNRGAYAEAAEFFAAAAGGENPDAGQTEALLNAALQQSNLGNYLRAEELFDEAGRSIGDDPVLTRLRRNYCALHLLNAGSPQEALAMLAQSLPQADRGTAVVTDPLVIDEALSERLNAEGARASSFALDNARLLPQERAQLLDGQADYIRGVIFRLDGRRDEAVAALGQAETTLGSVRRGRVASAVWMRAQISGELAIIAEQRNDVAEAERLYRSASGLVGSAYPDSPALLSANARLATFLARNGREAEAVTAYRAVVEMAAEVQSPSIRQYLEPYFAILASNADDPAAAVDMFEASQVLQQPGVAQTQAVLARELSGGSDAASALFRQSLDLSRDIESTRTTLARLSATENPVDSDALVIAELTERLSQLEGRQTAVQSELSQYPRYRVVSSNVMKLDDLQQVLGVGEAYLKMATFPERSYAVFITPEAARAYPIETSEAELENTVNALRSTISVEENGERLTYPFDVELAGSLYQTLFAPIDAQLADVRHLIFQPDGAMRRVPATLLISDRTTVDSYLARQQQPEADPFDYRGLAWLGRRMEMTTAISASAFRDIRQARRSDATNSYLGFGENARVDNVAAVPARVRSALTAGSSCQWSLAAWRQPISAAELVTARNTIAANGGDEGLVVTGAEFTDTRIKSMESIDDFRVLHFATHGLVAPPRPQCPPQPALLTSFGGDESDGLLTFSEIFDLDLDADLVILSACDTASSAGSAATEAAGLVTGGGDALDGLVRAFIGAGSRSIIASHWPVPDDFNATQRLISGLFTAPPGTSTAQALQAAQLQLMDQAETSHPYYWAAFAIVGDGAIAVIDVAS